MERMFIHSSTLYFLLMKIHIKQYQIKLVRLVQVLYKVKEINNSVPLDEIFTRCKFPVWLTCQSRFLKAIVHAVLYYTAATLAEVQKMEFW